MTLTKKEILIKERHCRNESNRDIHGPIAPLSREIRDYAFYQLVAQDVYDIARMAARGGYPFKRG